MCLPAKVDFKKELSGNPAFFWVKKLTLFTDGSFDSEVRLGVVSKVFFGSGKFLWSEIDFLYHILLSLKFSRRYYCYY